MAEKQKEKIKLYEVQIAVRTKIQFGQHLLFLFMLSLK